MADICDYKLAQGLEGDCSSPSIAGLRNKGYIINFDDIDFDNCEFDTSNPNLLTSLVLAAGKKAYEVYVPGKTPFTGTKKSLAAGTYKNKFNKDVTVVILNNGPDVCNKVIDKLANGTFVIILENKFRGSDNKNAFEIYGLESGLNATALDDDKYSADSDGGWLATFQETGSNKSGIFLFDTSLDATKTALESLVAGS